MDVFDKTIEFQKFGGFYIQVTGRIAQAPLCRFVYACDVVVLIGVSP